MKSIWQESTIKCSQLTSDIHCDIAVVGGGIAGFLTAYHLSTSGHKVSLFEAKTLFSGVTCKTTANIEALQGIKYSTFKDQSTANSYYESQISAIKEYASLVHEHNIDCDFERLDSFLYTTKNPDKLIKEFDALQAIEADITFIKNSTIMGQKAISAIQMHNQATFNPIKFLSNLPINFDIYENTKIIEIDFKTLTLTTLTNKITAKKIVVATNFPFINKLGGYFFKMYKSTSYVVSVPNKEDINGLYQDDEETGYTFRMYKDNLIVGGLDHRTGRIDYLEKYERLEEKAGKAEHKWQANDCITFDLIPYIGYYSKTSKDVYVITGFNKWGMANSMIGALLIRDMINNVKNPYEKLFSPQRCVINYEFLRNSLCVVNNIAIKPLIIPRKHTTLHLDEGDIVMYYGKKRAVYRDKQGNYHVCHYLCAHLKCQLQFNPLDKTWDCPCHGSRFDIDGNLLIAPSIKNLYRYK